MDAWHRRGPVMAEPDAADEVLGQADEQGILVAGRGSGLAIDERIAEFAPRAVPRFTGPRKAWSTEDAVAATLPSARLSSRPPTILPRGPIAALKKRICGSMPPFSSDA